jgi:hypothetical protein
MRPPDRKFVIAPILERLVIEKILKHLGMEPQPQPHCAGWAAPAVRYSPPAARVGSGHRRRHDAVDLRLNSDAQAAGMANERSRNWRRRGVRRSTRRHRGTSSYFWPVLAPVVPLQRAFETTMHRGRFSPRVKLLIDMNLSPRWAGAQPLTISPRHRVLPLHRLHVLLPDGVVARLVHHRLLDHLQALRHLRFGAAGLGVEL